MTERDKGKELPPEIINAYTSVFVNRRDQYTIQLKNGSYVAVTKDLSNNLIAAHLLGHITIGVHALDAHGWSKWLCVDADDDEYFGKLKGLSTSLSSQSIPSYLEASRRGGHLWLFFSPIPGFQARRLGKQLLAEANIPLRRKKTEGVELYPKQDRPRDGPGSLMRLPLGIHQKTGRRYGFIHPNGTPLAPSVRAQLKILANPEKLSQSTIDTILTRTKEEPSSLPSPPFAPKPKMEPVDYSIRPSERIKQTISVYEFVGQFMELDQEGKGFCPFHEDEHRSFQVNIEKNYWNCYADCGGGSIIDFWMLWRVKTKKDKKPTFKNTLRDLAKRLL